MDSLERLLTAGGALSTAALVQRAGGGHDRVLALLREQLDPLASGFSGGADRRSRRRAGGAEQTRIWRRAAGAGQASWRSSRPGGGWQPSSIR